MSLVLVATEVRMHWLRAPASSLDSTTKTADTRNPVDCVSSSADSTRLWIMLPSTPYNLPKSWGSLRCSRASLAGPSREPPSELDEVVGPSMSQKSW